MGIDRDIGQRKSSGLTAIDAHTHFVPSSIPDYAGGLMDVPWPSIEHHGSCCARVIISGKVFREIEDSCWRTERRCAEMEPMGITQQVLSPMPELLSYWMVPEAAGQLARHINGQIAATVAEGEGRFRGLAMVPLQDITSALRELEHAMTVLKLDGVEIGTNVNGKPIGDPAFDGFFAAAEAAGAIVFVHPLRAAGVDRLVGPPSLEQVVAFPCETALAIASLMTGGTLKRYPRLKLVFSHGGGAFAQILPRLQHAWSFLPALQDATGDAPVHLAQRLHFDSLVYSPIALRFLIDQFGSSRIVLGTDYPFAILDRTPVANLLALGLDPAITRDIASGNMDRIMAR